MPGKPTDITFTGDNLNRVTGLWASFDTESIVVKDSGSSAATFQIKPAASASPGIGAVRLVSANGLSDLIPLVIDDLPGIPANGANNSANTAQELKPPVAVDGVIDDDRSDYYRFHARRGERAALEVLAARIGSPLDPVLRVIGPDGKELAYVDDGQGIGPDLRLSMKMPATGEYVIELRDVNFQDGGKYHYRLRVGDFPLASGVFPMLARPGEATTFTPLGREVERIKPFNFALPSEMARVPHGLRFPRGESSALVSIAATEWPVVMEQEPNDAAATATKFPVPATLNGRFARMHDVDYYEFSAAKDQRLLFTARTRSLAMPCDLLMRIETPEGKKVAEANLTEADDGSITNLFKQGGSYRLRVEELNRRGGPQLAYAIEVAPVEPDFSVTAEVDKVEAAPGGAFELKFAITRRDFKGPLTLTLPGLGSNYEIKGDDVAEGAAANTMRVTVPRDARGGEAVLFHVVATGKIGDRTVSHRVSTLPALKKIWTRDQHVPLELNGQFWLGIIAPAK